MKKRRHQYLIVGSGAGGAALAVELCCHGADVLVLERGQRIVKMGTTPASTSFYDVNPLTRMPKKSKEGVILWRTFMAGGSTMVSCGNATPCMLNEFASFGIDLKNEIASVLERLPQAPTDLSLLSSGSLRLKESAKNIGFEMKVMPKFVRAELCRKCGKCTMGCVYGARWSALEFLDEACANGCEVIYGVEAQQVVFEGQRAVGVIAAGANGEMFFDADTVILAAGGLGTPIILQRSGIEEAGQELFMDLFINAYGIVPDCDQLNEPLMALVLDQFHESQGFIISPYINLSRLGRFIEMGAEGAALSSRNLLGLMTKITDEMTGRVFPDGAVSKPVADRDLIRLDAGFEIAKKILVQAGADPLKIKRSKVQGAHPGGTARIGKVVNIDLQTRMENLYVCDASVFPATPGLPPIITILALARRLADHLLNK